ncbi:MAG TPA: IPT/TIG domain-containing protein [Solirubrobacteraceae bacterium]|nr:IPT/TIG domain-containing protein [Solirubrobacteraceae bacterium]
MPQSRRSRAAPLLAATLLALLGGALAPARGLALVVTLGTPTASFGANQSLSSCSSCTQFQLVAPGYSLTAPAAGRVTVWRAMGRGPLALRILRPEGAGLVAVAASGSVSLAGTGTFAVSLPIAAGDQIGVDLLPTTAPTPSAQLHFANLSGALFGQAQPAAAAGAALNAGSQASGAISLNADVAIAPVATGLDVTSGSTAGGTPVAVTGRFLDGVTSVTIGGTPASFTLGPAGALLVRTPAHAAGGPFDLVASGPGGTSTLPAAFTYVAAPAPIPGAGTPGGGPAGSGGPGASATNPDGSPVTLMTLTNLALSPAAFVAARSGPPLGTSAAVGSRIAYTVPVVATTSLVFQAAVPGLLVPGRGGVGRYCQPAHRPVQPAARCTTYAAPSGSITHLDRPGLNLLRFTGRLAGRTLAPGSYRLTATATDRHGNRSKPATHAFRILGPPAHR